MQKSINRQVKEQETIIVELKLQKLWGEVKDNFLAQTTPLSSNQISELEELIKSRDTIYNGKPIQSIQEGEFEGFLRTPSEIK